jgi:predicted phosphodiesterase
MRYAILADIHANLQAFEAVLEDMKKQSCTHAVCLGDIVGYNANPKECLDIIRGMNIPCVKGNHDEYASNEEPLDGFNEKAAQAVTWTRRQLPRRTAIGCSNCHSLWWWRDLQLSTPRWTILTAGDTYSSQEEPQLILATKRRPSASLGTFMFHSRFTQPEG